jgi:hypothetical protein
MVTTHREIPETGTGGNLRNVALLLSIQQDLTSILCVIARFCDAGKTGIKPEKTGTKKVISRIPDFCCLRYSGCYLVNALA